MFIFLLLLATYFFLRSIIAVPVIEHALYINLGTRPDRKASVELQLQKAGIPAKRINAEHIPEGDPRLSKCWDPANTKKCAGQIGCLLSHIKALEYAVAQNWPYVAIFEDDFSWVEGLDLKNVQHNVRTVQRLKPDWDAIVLSLNVQEQETFEDIILPFGENRQCKLTRVHQALATHGYILHSRLFHEVINVFKKCDVASDLFIAVDTCWQSIQKETRWYGLTPQMATQAESFSDIEGTTIFYGIN